jgi:sugar phosphate isomerase/epimerase
MLPDMIHGNSSIPARVLFSTGSLNLTDTAYSFELAAEAGFDGIEIMCDDRWSTRDPVYLQSLMTRHHLPILAVHSSIGSRLRGWTNARDELARIQHSLRLAETLAAEVLVVHVPMKIGVAEFNWPGGHIIMPWRTPYVGVKRWIEQDLPAVQARTAVKIALEDVPSFSIFRRKIDLAWWNTLNDWPQAHQWLTMDTSHWASKDIDPLTAFRAGGERIAHVHLSNFDAQRKKYHRLPQQGDLDLAGLLHAMADAHFSGTISVELYPDALDFHDGDAVRGHMRGCLTFCRTHLTATESAMVMQG